MERLIARSYARLIRAGRRTLADVPEGVVDALREIAPDLFGEEEQCSK